MPTRKAIRENARCHGHRCAHVATWFVVPDAVDWSMPFWCFVVLVCTLPVSVVASGWRSGTVFGNDGDVPWGAASLIVYAAAEVVAILACRCVATMLHQGSVPLVFAPEPWLIVWCVLAIVGLARYRTVRCSRDSFRSRIG